MDPFHDKAGNERRASLRMSARQSTTVDGDDDEYDLAAAMGLSDGFRPTQVSASHPTTSSTTNPSTGSAVVSRDSPAVQRAVAPARPSSIAKPPRAHDNFALRHDGSASQATGPSISRVSTASTESPIIRSESPYEGPSGPSHPYQMYPQRTNSVATTSTARMSERSYAGPRGPTHPYTLYTQNTVPVDTHEGDNIPVGFGRSDNYQRRMGAEGEDMADLIGPLGHTEELPPYTRYPEQAYARKQPGEMPQQAAQPQPQPQQQEPQQPLVQQQLSPQPSGQQQPTQPVVTVMAASVPPAPIPGAGGLGLATRNPEFESREELRLPSRMSSRTLTSDTASQHEINTAAEAYAEKGEESKDKKWQKRAKRRMFGVIPYWAICLLAVGLVLMGIILGAVIGTFFAKHKKPPGRNRDDEPVPLVIPTATVDIKPLATLPPDLPSMEIGVFGLPPLIASQAPSTCFNDTTQSQAWTCNIPFTSYVMSVSRIANELPISDYTLKLTTFNDSDSNDKFNMFSWGTQPPLIIDPLKMRLVNDTSEPGRGAAWFAQMTYNKTVIVAEDRFPGVSTPRPSSKKRWNGPPPSSGDFSRKGIKGAQAGDRPWICTWPGTLLEVFVYPAQNNSYQRKPTSTTKPLAAATAPPTSTPFLVRHGLATPTYTTIIPTDRPRKAPPPPYPQVIKFEERRVSLDQTKNAYCRQVEVCDDGENTVPVLNEEGQPVEVMIMENRQTVAIADSKRWIHEDSFLVSRDRPARTSQLSDCGCIWWFT
ncbi:hypothetical protein CkaCkLH20_06452 [Colletotrichum karsti]|uniref:DUF7820 domain-containing protein n=1 Tax=Colletotrichum karsti TaxID=1095194 RepID=A0A9P6I8Q4_9PEZI|nr:uncharacterized protein CkaCkLH20_06452 [Colletotrichum karsti]KAF9876006.1 hypothetical protein CkaCkLH20_06452 [Colletotrichum karsti]